MFSLNSDSLMSSGLNISYFYEVTMLLFEAVVTKGKVVEHNYGKRILFSSDSHRSSTWLAWLEGDHS